MSENGKIATANPTRSIVRNSDIVRVRLNRLHDTDGLVWREIASLNEYSGIPPGTLCSIAKGAEVPKKYRKKLGIPVMKPAPACKCGEVHTKKGCPYEGKRTRDDDWYNTVQDIVSWANGEPWSGKRYARMRTLYRK